MAYKDYNPKMNEYMKARYQTRRLQALDYLGGVCVECGDTNDLVFDHIDPETKEYSIAKIMCHRWDKVKAELDKCQLLCKICNTEKTKINLHNIVMRNGWKNGYGSGSME